MRPEAAPDRRREARKNIRLAADLPAYEILAGLVNPERGCRGSKRRDGSRRKRPLERSNPCGEREYRAALSPCQANSEKREIANEDGPLLGIRMHKNQGISYLAGRESSTFAMASG